MTGWTSDDREMAAAVTRTLLPLTAKLHTGMVAGPAAVDMR